MSLAFLIVIGGGLALWVKSLDPADLFTNTFVQNQIGKMVDKDVEAVFEVLPTLLGFDEPKTYLLLFLNNTELRPGGGFIGTYATVEVSKANVRMISFEGIELLDYRTPDAWRPTPPAILSEELGVDRWYMRDANWSPDFAISSKKVLEFYKAQGGRASEDIDAVVGVTGTVLERLLELTGPIVVEGKTFNAKDVIEVLEYEVEFGYRDKGVDKASRKQIIRPFFEQLVSRIKQDVLTQPDAYQQTFLLLSRQRHLMAYGVDSDLQSIFEKQQVDGQVEQASEDYVMWVDANLAALKTDHAIERTVHYSVRNVLGDWVHDVHVEYDHKGMFDWRTSRYRTYARVYVPKGAKLRGVYMVDASGNKHNVDLVFVDQGSDAGKQWFGTLAVVEPGTSESVGFTYQLPEALESLLHDDDYNLLLQKQLGVVNMRYNIEIEHDKPVQVAEPAEQRSKWGDLLYSHAGALNQDQTFRVSF